MLTNEQLIDNNNLTPIGRKSEPFLADHIWYRAMTPHGVFNSGPAGALLVFFFAYAFYLAFRSPLQYLLSLCCKGMVIEDFEIDEEIDYYQHCLDEDDKMWTIKEEENMVAYGMSTLLESTEQSF